MTKRVSFLRLGSGQRLSVFSVILTLREAKGKNLLLSPNRFLIRDSSGDLPPRNDKKEGDPSASPQGDI